MMPHGSIMCTISPWDLSMGGESLIFEAAIGYCCLLIVVGQESAPSPKSL